MKNIRLEDLIETIFYKQEIDIMLTYCGMKLERLYHGERGEYTPDGEEYTVSAIELYPELLMICVEKGA